MNQQESQCPANARRDGGLSAKWPRIGETNAGWSNIEELGIRWLRRKNLADALVAVKRLARVFLGGYSQVLFNRSLVSGLLFVAATLIVPLHGLAGLLGLAASNLWAHLLGRSKEQIDEGLFAFNGLLVGLALGLYYRFSMSFVLLLLVATLLTVLVATFVWNFSLKYVGIPTLSIAFVATTWVALLATQRFSGVELTIETVLASKLGAGVFPEMVELYFRSLAAVFFQLSVVSGILVFLGLLWFSRWATILSIISFGSGAAVYLSLGGVPSDLSSQFVGFNFILTGIAVGGVWLVLCPASMLYAAAGGAVSAVLSAALVTFLKPLGLPVLATPFIITTQLLLFIVMIRAVSGRLQWVAGVPDSPEQNLSRAIYRARRYPDPTVPRVYLPVMGRWTITQGHDGAETHQGAWSHAWDFEVKGEDGRTYRNEGLEVTDYYAFGAPVVAPAEGKVVRVVNHLDDNPVGEVDTVNNWGNLVILWHSGDVYTAICHLRKHSVAVMEGQTVARGQLLGYVGNSGRSPYPHLHFQFQSTGDVGAPTRYGEFIHYIQETKGSLEQGHYITHGSPKKGELVVAMEVDDNVRRAVALAPGMTWRWSVKKGDERWEEQWQSKIDALGNRQLMDLEADTRTSFFTDDHYATFLDFEGSSARVLGLLYLGIGRIPFQGESRVTWSDTPAPLPFLPWTSRLAQQLLLPFVELVRLNTASSFVSNQRERVQVNTRLEVTARMAVTEQLPDRIEVELAVGTGPCAMRAYRDGVLTLSAELIS